MPDYLLFRDDHFEHIVIVRSDEAEKEINKKEKVDNVKGDNSGIVQKCPCVRDFEDVVSMEANDQIVPCLFEAVFRVQLEPFQILLLDFKTTSPSSLVI